MYTVVHLNLFLFASKCIRNNNCLFCCLAVLMVIGCVAVFHRVGPSLAFWSLWNPDLLHGVLVCVVSSLLLSQKSMQRKRLCLKYVSQETPSLPYLILPIHSSPSPCLYHLLPIHVLNVPNLLIWSRTFKPCNQPRHKAKT
jgi:hypothetical protein